jgi:hypothetical protein
MAEFQNVFTRVQVKGQGNRVNEYVTNR